MKAIFEVTFKKSAMFTDDELKKEFGGSLFKAMKWLVDLEGIGIFDVDDFKLKEIKK